MATGCDQRSRDPEGASFGCGTRMRNRKLRNIRHSGAFTPEMTSSKSPEGVPWKGARMWNRKLRNIRSNVTRSTSPGSYVIGSALGVFSRASASYYRFIALSLVICPFPAILFSWGAPSIEGHCIYPSLWLALYRGCINLFFPFFSILFFFSIFFFFFLFFFWYLSYYFWYLFFHNTCLTSNNTKFCTMVIASTGFSKSLVTSVMLCPAYRWMR